MEWEDNEKKQVVVVQEYLLLERVTENMTSPELIFFQKCLPW